ncbi:MAG: esterase family protein [Ruminiclostridium sp.]|nr:esterase family protein [Ruminiclostridium sp.]
MALLQCNFFSETLGIGTAMNVILPQTSCLKGKKSPVLYLLHGHSDDHTAWLRRTSIERYAEQRELAVVMPAVNRSFYTDMKYGYKYGTFMSEELPAIAQSFFPVSDKREDTFAAGLSMGGYGALKLALGYPERFAAAASLSGVVDIAGYPPTDKNFELDLIFEDIDKLKGSKDDLFYLAEKVAASNEVKPSIYQCCGTEDFLYEDNIRFRDFMKKLPFDYFYEEEPGIHEWGYWDRMIQRVLKWLPIRE